MSFRLFVHTRFFRYLIVTCLMIVLSICTACGDDDDQSSSSNASRPIIGSWQDVYGNTFTASETHFAIDGGSWGYSGRVLKFNTKAQYFVIMYTNINSMLMTTDLVGRYNLIRWKDFSLSGSTASISFQEGYDSTQTNSIGKFIAWPSQEAAETEVKIGAGWTEATSTNWHP